MSKKKFIPLSHTDKEKLKSVLLSLVSDSEVVAACLTNRNAFLAFQAFQQRKIFVCTVYRDGVVLFKESIDFSLYIEPLPTQAQEPLPTQAQEPLPTQAQEPLPIQAQEPLPTKRKVRGKGSNPVKVNVSFVLEPDILQTLYCLADSQDRTLSNLLRFIIKQYLLVNNETIKT